MKIRLWTLVVIGMMTVLNTNAESYQDMEPLKLVTPEMKPELDLRNLPANPFVSKKAEVETSIETSYSDNKGLDFDFFK